MIKKVVDFFFNNGESIESAVNILQSIIIIFATVFTAFWAYKTFAYKEKITELKELKKMIRLYRWHIQIFCSQVRKGEVPDKKELEEKVELAGIHNKLVELYDLNLFTKKDVRQKVQDIVGNWLTNDRINKLHYRHTSKISDNERKEIWKQFNDEYDEVVRTIDAETSSWI